MASDYSDLTRPPLTPTRPKSAGTGRPYRESMEDADSSSTRKRPRLDSGDRAYRSMSADPLRATPSDSGLAKASVTPADGQPSSQSSEVANGLPPMAFTPSKVTINVREPAGNTSPTQSSTKLNGAPSMRGGGGGGETCADHSDSSNKMDSPSPHIISVASSSSHSPEIEVAEVEDMNDDSGETRWKSLISATSAKDARDVQALLLDQFPHNGRNVKQTLARIAAAFEKNDLGEGDLLDEVAGWIELYLQTTEPHASQWWEMIQDEREFWDEFPSLVQAIMHRSNTRSGTLRMAYSDHGDILDNQSPLQNFLVAYTSLALRMARIDCQTLVEHFEDGGSPPDLISERALFALFNVMGYGFTFWRHLVDPSRYDIKVTITAMVTRFFLPPEDGVTLMTRISKEIFDRSQSVPGLFPRFFTQINLVVRLMQQLRHVQGGTSDVDKAMEASLQGLASEAYEFFTVVDARFQNFISKQVSALTIETSQGLVSQLSMLLRAIAGSDEQLTRKFLAERMISAQNVSREESEHLVELAWKFDMLKRCILEGRMEIRVQGVETMQLELVGVYGKYITNSPALKDHPIAQYLSDFMLNNKLVEYFVGVESHPQLINRCGNIIGFLVVTHRYTEAESDVIWKAVTNSQDSRFVDALLHMLPGIFNIAQYPILLYLTTKLNELPVHAFDGSMIHFTRTLLEHLQRTWRSLAGDQKTDMMDMPPFHLCIRLIRQSAVERSLEPSRKRDIHNFATEELRTLLAFGPSDTDRKTIYQECIRDISDRNEFATGSISAICALLTQNSETEIFSLTQEFDLAPLVVREFAHMIHMERSTSCSSEMLHERLDARLYLIQAIILHVPDTITSDVGTQLWDFAVGSEALNNQARESAWMSFLRVMRTIANKNSFFDQCVRQHLPRLQPRYYTQGCLAFVQDVGHYHLRISASRSEDDTKQEPTAADLLWQLSLTAPPGGIELRAINGLVALYLDSPDNQRRTRAATEAIHIGVVERCIRQLTSAASKLKAFSDGTSSGEDEPMVIVASDDEVHVQKLSFSRSLMILKEFIRGVRSRPRYSPQIQSQPQLLQGPRKIKGEPIQIRYQSFGGGSSDIRTVEVGDLETIHELSRRLKSLTGFSKLTVIAGGQKLDLNNISDRTLQDIKLHQKGLLLVKRDSDTESLPDLAPASGLRPVEIEILTHFPEMYQLLALDEKLGKEVFEFLVAFPPHTSITTLVCSSENPVEAIFPSAAPFKVLYSLYAFKQCLVYQTQNGPTVQDLTIHGIRSLTGALLTLNLNIASQGAEVDITVAIHLLECLMAFLKEPVSLDGTESLFTDPLALLTRLQSLIKESLDVDGNQDADILALTSFATLLKISLRSEIFWNQFKDTGMSSALLRRLLLQEPKWEIRRRVADYIKGICSDLHKTQTAPALDFIPYFWDNIAPIIPYCFETKNTSQEFFEVASTVFQCIDHAHRKTLDLALYVQSWSELLLRHEHDEFVGRDTVDWLVFGLSNLLHWVFQMAKSLGRTPPTPDGLSKDLFRAHLFPEISNLEECNLIENRVPNLNSNPRQELYSITLMLSNDIGDYQKLLMLVRDLLSRGEDSHAWSWGIAQILEEYHYEQNWNFERNKSIRSPTGYPGMKNLSNTCYMNSLFTQLFMNVNFRGFMLSANVADPTVSQRLLHETQTMFGFMQESVLKAVDSQGIVDSLITYENSLIDVSVQMDVDEFYNLLFDRWESQILLGVDKKTFRGFYGGQIVQQIKSKECPHISERLEPFSAIQCDILGKATLMDSLNAYVSGETMEGDNKYSCTSCGCYVDAVKRACLKDIPDNLIFHLKRFDYDVMSGQRSKINDQFEFPHRIDMAPYHADYQKDGNAPSEPDLFELSGVLVHSGTAESGHYYSYIRERPPNSADSNSWVEFNDMDVTKFDPNNIADQCFGGFGEASPYTTRFLKNWNAYMLFYERVDSRTLHVEVQPSTVFGVPAKCAVPTEIQARVALNNAQYLRNYCMFDPAHAVFARELLEQLRQVNKGICSDDHKTEKEAIWLSLDYLERVLCRSKDCSDFGKMLTSLTKVIGSCAVCCRHALEWVVFSDRALRNLLLRCPNQRVRKDFATMIVVALRYLKKNDPRRFGFNDSGDSQSPSSDIELRSGGVFPRIVGRLKELWPVLYLNARGWDDYFGLLTELAHLGMHETHVILNHGFLQGCLEILVVDHGKASRLRNENTHYINYARLLEKGRRFSLIRLTDLLASLLETVDLTIEWVRRFQDRRFNPNGMKLVKQEDELMQLGSDITRSKNICIFLEKILSVDCNLQSTKQIVKVMTLAEPQFGMLEHVQKTITSGINIEPAHLAAPYLRAAITFCEATPTEQSAQDMIRYIAGEVDTIGDYGGREHLEFFSQARRIMSLRDGFEPGFFNCTVLRAVPQWAPALLHYCDDSVRNSTMDLLKHLVFTHDLKAMDDEEHAELIETAAKDLQVACTRRCNGLVQRQKTVDAKSVEQIMTVIKYCCHNYYSPEEDQRPLTDAENVLSLLEALTVSDVDEAASDTWNNNSDDMPTDSDSEFLTTSP